MLLGYLFGSGLFLVMLGWPVNVQHNHKCQHTLQERARGGCKRDRAHVGEGETEHTWERQGWQAGLAGRLVRRDMQAGRVGRQARQVQDRQAIRVGRFMIDQQRRCRFRFNSLESSLEQA